MHFSIPSFQLKIYNVENATGLGPLSSRVFMRTNLAHPVVGLRWYPERPDLVKMRKLGSKDGSSPSWAPWQPSTVQPRLLLSCSPPAVDPVLCSPGPHYFQAVGWTYMLETTKQPHCHRLVLDNWLRWWHFTWIYYSPMTLYSGFSATSSSWSNYIFLLHYHLHFMFEISFCACGVKLRIFWTHLENWLI